MVNKIYLLISNSLLALLARNQQIDASLLFYPHPKRRKPLIGITNRFKEKFSDLACDVVHNLL